MQSFKAELLVKAENSVGESAIWDAATQCLYWVDIPKGLIQRLGPDGIVQRWTAPIMIGSIVLAADGTLLAATKVGFARVSLDGDAAVLTPVASVLANDPGKRFNDGACDRQGRFWSGTMRLQQDPDIRDGVLYCLGNDGVAAPHLDGFLTQNGLAWSPNGQVMYVSDSHPAIRTIWAFDFDTAAGTLSNRRVFCNDLPGRPDGAAMDVDGCYWIAATDAGKILRLTPDGRIDAEVVVPAPNPTKPCFGGADMRTMFITSLRSGGRQDAIGGDVYAVALPFEGMPETRAILSLPSHHQR